MALFARTRYWTFELHAPWEPSVYLAEPKPEPPAQPASRPANPARPYDPNRDDPPAPVLAEWNKRWAFLLSQLSNFPDAYRHCRDKLGEYDEAMRAVPMPSEA